jgi:hypothetical protein
MAVSYADAQIVPYKASGLGMYSPVNGDYGGAGVATHLGRHNFSGKVVTTPTIDPLIFNFLIDARNPQETVAANGDKIFFSGSGTVQLIPTEPTFTYFSANWSGNFVVEGGTGRFANAGPGPQPLDVVAINAPFTLADPVWNFNWTLNGKIRLKK